MASDETPKIRLFAKQAILEVQDVLHRNNEAEIRKLVCSFAHWDGEHYKALRAMATGGCVWTATATDKALADAAQDRLHVAIWAQQDGYGEAGFTPCQGWDWSGIRDSSPQGMRNMAGAIVDVMRWLDGKPSMPVSGTMIAAHRISCTD